MTYIGHQPAREIVQYAGSRFDYVNTGNPAIDTNPQSVGATWLNLTTGEEFVCAENTTGGNRWEGSLRTVVGRSSYVFNSTDNSYAYGTPVYDGDGDFTFEGWIKVDVGYIGYGDIISMRQPFFDTQPIKLILLRHQNGQFVTSARRADNTIVTITSVGTGYNDATWYHVAAVRSGSTFYLYIDGGDTESLSVAGWTDNVIDATNDVTLGHYYDPAGSTWYPLDGALSLCRIWDIARTPAQIKADWNTVLPSTTANLLNQFAGANYVDNELYDTQAANGGMLYVGRGGNLPS